MPFIDDDGSLPSSRGGGAQSASSAPSIYIVPSNGATPDLTQPLKPVSNKLLSMEICEDLETKEEKRLRFQSHKIVYFTAFIMSMGFSIVLTSVWPYLKQVSVT